MYVGLTPTLKEVMSSGQQQIFSLLLSEDPTIFRQESQGSGAIHNSTHRDLDWLLSVFFLPMIIVQAR